ncbi:MAG TPA: transcriptional repressor [Candidatus Kapabacteria bacterium]|nr:transcriptional repressor [Candidatus Kapabacteria bacterium]
MEATTSLPRRKTKQRELVLEIVRRLKSHPTAEEVYYVAKRTMPNLSLGTVYRNLGVLVAEGSITEVTFEAGKSRFDGMIEKHEHFICERCGSVTDITPTPSMKHSPITHPELRELSVSGYDLVYHGICRDCRHT